MPTEEFFKLQNVMIQRLSYTKWKRAKTKQQMYLKKTKPYIYGIVCIDKQIAPADATIHAAHSQTETKGEEVTMIVMANTVVKPS